jgi:hypothetical protein
MVDVQNEFLRTLQRKVARTYVSFACIFLFSYIIQRALRFWLKFLSNAGHLIRGPGFICALISSVSRQQYQTKTNFVALSPQAKDTD